MFPADFIYWISRNMFHYIEEHKGWYHWPTWEKEEMRVCDTLDELFEIYNNDPQRTLTN